MVSARSRRRTAGPFAADLDCARRRRVGRAPRPRSRPGAKRGSLSSNGRPGTRQGVRTPHLRAAMPVDAYSLAVSCGGRGVSSDIWPANLFGTRRAARCLVQARRGFPRPARCVAPRPYRRRAGFPGVARFRAMRLPGRWWFRPPLPSARLQYRSVSRRALLLFGKVPRRHRLSITRPCDRTSVEQSFHNKWVHDTSRQPQEPALPR